MRTPKDATTTPDKERVLARVHADELELVSGGGCTVVITGGGHDITNVEGDNDGCSV